MHEKGAIQRRLYRWKRPDRVDELRQCPAHRRDRNEPERVIEQVHRDIGKHHQTRGEADAADHRHPRSGPEPRYRREDGLAIMTPIMPRLGLRGSVAGVTRGWECSKSATCTRISALWWRSTTYRSPSRAARCWVFSAPMAPASRRR